MQNNIYNVGEIALRKDDCFWIFDIAYLMNKEYNIYSPWFSCFGEKWRLIKEPHTESSRSMESMNYVRHLKLPFHIKRKMSSNLLKHMYTIQLRLMTNHGSKECVGVIDLDYGSRLEFPTIKETDIVSKNRLVKLFFNLQREENGNTDIERSDEEASNEVERNNHDEENSNDEEHSDYEENNHDEDEENGENEESGDCIVSSDSENANKIKPVVAGVKGIKKLAENFKQFLLDERITDAVLKVDGREFKVHKAILAARSSVFASMFEHDLAERNTNAVDIPDCTAESFEVFLYYLYSGSVEKLSANNIYNVYYAADKYHVNDLKELCVKFMKRNLSVETFCDIITLSLRHGESKLQKAAMNYFCKNVKKIIKTVQWQQYMEENSTQANELFIKALKA